LSTAESEPFENGFVFFASIAGHWDLLLESMSVTTDGGQFVVMLASLSLFTYMGLNLGVLSSNSKVQKLVCLVDGQARNTMQDPDAIFMAAAQRDAEREFEQEVNQKKALLAKVDELEEALYQARTRIRGGPHQVKFRDAAMQTEIGKPPDLFAARLRALGVSLGEKRDQGSQATAKTSDSEMQCVLFEPFEASCAAVADHQHVEDGCRNAEDVHVQPEVCMPPPIDNAKEPLEDPVVISVTGMGDAVQNRSPCQSTSTSPARQPSASTSQAKHRLSQEADKHLIAAVAVQLSTGTFKMPSPKHSSPATLRQREGLSAMQCDSKGFPPPLTTEEFFDQDANRTTGHVGAELDASEVVAGFYTSQQKLNVEKDYPKSWPRPFHPVSSKGGIIEVDHPVTKAKPRECFYRMCYM